MIISHKNKKQILKNPPIPLQNKLNKEKWHIYICIWVITDKINYDLNKTLKHYCNKNVNLSNNSVKIDNQFWKLFKILTSNVFSNYFWLFIGNSGS